MLFSCPLHWMLSSSMTPVACVPYREARRLRDTNEPVTLKHTHTHTWWCNCRSYDKQSFLLGDQFTHTHTHTHKHTYRHLIHTDTPTHIHDRHIHTLSLSLSLSITHTHTHVWWPSMPYPSPKADRQMTSVLSCDQYPSHTMDHTPS